jgi:hypothetical protein
MLSTKGPKLCYSLLHIEHLLTHHNRNGFLQYLLNIEPHGCAHRQGCLSTAHGGTSPFAEATNWLEHADSGICDSLTALPKYGAIFKNHIFHDSSTNLRLFAVDCIETWPAAKRAGVNAILRGGKPPFIMQIPPLNPSSNISRRGSPGTELRHNLPTRG